MHFMFFSIAKFTKKAVLSSENIWINWTVIYELNCGIQLKYRKLIVEKFLFKETTEIKQYKNSHYCVYKYDTINYKVLFSTKT